MNKLGYHYLTICDKFYFKNKIMQFKVLCLKLKYRSNVTNMFMNNGIALSAVRF